VPHTPDSERRKKRDAAIRAQDDAIAEHLAHALKSGELQSAPSFGKPLKDMEGYAETPAEFRMPFKILRNAGVVPPEVGGFQKCGELRRQIEQADTEEARKTLQRKLSELEQMLKLRLEGMKASGKL
jgi:hypothetical protein